MRAELDWLIKRDYRAAFLQDGTNYNSWPQQRQSLFNNPFVAEKSD
jgi:hypothetical protein